MLDELQLPPGCEWMWSDLKFVVCKTADGDIVIAEDCGEPYGLQIRIMDPHIVLPVLERLWRDEVERLWRYIKRWSRAGAINIRNHKKREFCNEKLIPLYADLGEAESQLAAAEAAWKVLKGESDAR